MRVEGNSLWPAPTPFQGTNLRVPVPTRSLVYSRNRRRKTLFSDYSDACDNTLDEHFKAEKHSFVESLHHRDAQEGISAFLQKRKPAWPPH